MNALDELRRRVWNDPALALRLRRGDPARAFDDALELAREAGLALAPDDLARAVREFDLAWLMRHVA